MAIKTISRTGVEAIVPAVVITAPVVMAATLARVTRYYEVDTETEAEIEYGTPVVEYLYGATVASLISEIQQKQAQLQARIDAFDDEILALEAL